MISNWAILLCKFADDTSTTRPMQDYRDLFTGSGTGTNNMTDFFRDVSHGKLDTTGSQVFGWYTIALKTAEFEHTQEGRNKLVAACKQAGVDAGVDLSKYSGVVVSMNGVVDLFGYVGGMTAFCSSDNLEPSLLGQEMGHGYGLDHSRRDGSEEDYQDIWDTMSTAGAREAPDPRWTHIGPGLNAANMRGRDWLDESRVWKPGPDNFKTTIILRPLHRRDLPGYLAAELPWRRASGVPGSRGVGRRHRDRLRARAPVLGQPLVSDK